MALNIWECPNCNGGGYADDGDGNLIACKQTAITPIEIDEELARTDWQRRPTVTVPVLSPEECNAEALRRVTGGMRLVGGGR